MTKVSLRTQIQPTLWVDVEAEVEGGEDGTGTIEIKSLSIDGIEATTTIKADAMGLGGPVGKVSFSDAFLAKLTEDLEDELFAEAGR